MPRRVRKGSPWRRDGERDGAPFSEALVQRGAGARARGGTRGRSTYLPWISMPMKKRRQTSSCAGRTESG